MAQSGDSLREVNPDEEKIHREDDRERVTEASSSTASAADESDHEDHKSGLDKLRELFARTLNIVASKGENDLDDSKEESIKESSLLTELSLKGIAKYIQSENCKNIIIMSGAGVSTSAGIPDFRSPGSGLYDNLGKYNLPDPQCIFDISFFKKEPRPFFSLAKELLPGRFKPTVCHYFLRLLNEKTDSTLLRIYTQNVDGLERIAGVPPEKLVEAHGTFHSSHCLKCQAEYSLDWMKERILADETPICQDCKSFVKPDIVFFGENLPRRFFTLCSQDFPKCDLLIILGTSLVVQPFASLIDKVPKKTPRLLINKEKAGQRDPLMRFLGHGSGLDFDSKHNHRDVAWLGMCDDGCQQLADLLGFGDELRRIVKEEHEKMDKLK